LPPGEIAIDGVAAVSIVSNADARGRLNEIFRQSWPGAFPTVQWNACVSEAGVVRGVHVHTDYDEFYTLPRGRVILGLADIRRESPTFGVSHQLEWSSADGIAVTIPKGVAHVFLVEDDTVLVFGLSSYWQAEQDDIGCQWDAPELGFVWPDRPVVRSERDSGSGTYAEMVERFEARRRDLLTPS